MKFFRRSDLSWTALVRQWAGKLLVLSSLVIVACTLYPFHREGAIPDELGPLFKMSGNISDRKDMVANILLFMPWGLGLTGWLWLRRVPIVGQWILVSGLSAAFSGTVEIVQMFLPTRYPSYIDVLTNALGGACGLLCFYGAGGWIFRRVAALVQGLQRRFGRWPTAKLWASFGAYLAVTLVATLLLYGTSLHTWNLNLPLHIGGQPGDPSWSGTVADVSWSDRAAAPDRWPPTVTAPVINAGIRRSSQFSLGATIAVSAENQADSGFHRMIALADSNDLGNLALGQFRHHLLVWVQTAISRQRFYQTFVINAFADPQPHRIQASYGGFTLKVFVDGQRVAVRSLMPEPYKIGGALLVFLPLSFLLSLIANRQPVTVGRGLILGMALVLPAMIFASGGAWIGDRPRNDSMLLLSWMIMGGNFLLFRHPVTAPAAYSPPNSPPPSF